MLEHDRHGFFDIVSDSDEGKVLFGNGTGVQQGVTQPLEQPAPEVRAEVTS